MPKSQKYLRSLCSQIFWLCQHCQETISKTTCADPLHIPLVWDAKCSIIQRMLFGL